MTEDFGVIYTLNDPRDGEPRYVGATVNPKARLQRHLEEPSNEDTREWLGELDEKGLNPLMTLIDYGKKSELREKESEAIHRLNQEYDLLNEQLLSGYPSGEETVSVFIPDKVFWDGYVVPEGSRHKARQKIKEVVEEGLE